MRASNISVKEKYSKLSLKSPYKLFLSGPIPVFVEMFMHECTVKILKFGTPQTIAIIVLKIEKIDVTLH